MGSSPPARNTRSRSGTWPGRRRPQTGQTTSREIRSQPTSRPTVTAVRRRLGRQGAEHLCGWFSADSVSGRTQSMNTVSVGRRATLSTALAVTTLACPAIGQGRFPNRPIRFLIPWAPGGTLDGFMRLQAELFQQDTGQTLVIETRPGARGTLAAQFLLNQARPDGYTIAHHH